MLFVQYLLPWSDPCSSKTPLSLGRDTSRRHWTQSVGNEAIDALLSAGVRKLKSSTKENGVLIEERISEWLQKMELAHSFQLIPTGSLEDKNYEVRIQKSPNSAEVTLAGSRSWVADLFPLLVHCYYVPEGSTLILGTTWYAPPSKGAIPTRRSPDRW